jgi:plasmid maintenance system antidote protein VapI
MREHRNAALKLVEGKGAGIAVNQWMLKHGPESIVMEFLHVCFSQAEADRLEILEIAQRREGEVEMLNHSRGGNTGGSGPWKFCKKGLHELSGDNVVYKSHGTRTCRECARLRASARWQRRKIDYRGTKEKAADQGVPYIDPRSPLQDEYLMIRVLARNKLGWRQKDIAQFFELPSHTVRSVVKRYHVVDGNLIYKGSRRSLQNVDGFRPEGENNPSAKLTKSEALAIYLDPRNAKEISLDSGTPVQTVWAIKSGRTWSSATGAGVKPRRTVDPGAIDLVRSMALSGVTQVRIANDLGLSRATVCNIIGKKRNYKEASYD